MACMSPSGMDFADSTAQPMFSRFCEQPGCEGCNRQDSMQQAEKRGICCSSLQSKPCHVKKDHAQCSALAHAAAGTQAADCKMPQAKTKLFK